MITRLFHWSGSHITSRGYRIYFGPVNAGMVDSLLLRQRGLCGARGPSASTS